MNSKAKGAISESAVLHALLKRGATVSIPYGDNARYDLVLDEDAGQLTRVQVKTGRIYQGCITFNSASVNGFTGRKTGYHGPADVFLVYCPANERIYRIPVSECGSSTTYLRIEPTKGPERSTIKWAKDYEL